MFVESAMEADRRFRSVIKFHRKNQCAVALGTPKAAMHVVQTHVDINSGRDFPYCHSSVEGKIPTNKTLF